MRNVPYVIRCVSCTRYFSSSIEMRRHFQQEHFKSFWFCFRCSDSLFQAGPSLKMHMQKRCFKDDHVGFEKAWAIVLKCRGENDEQVLLDPAKDTCLECARQFSKHDSSLEKHMLLCGPRHDASTVEAVRLPEIWRRHRLPNQELLDSLLFYFNDHWTTKFLGQLKQVIDDPTQAEAVFTKFRDEVDYTSMKDYMTEMMEKHPFSPQSPSSSRRPVRQPSADQPGTSGTPSVTDPANRNRRKRGRPQNANKTSPPGSTGSPPLLVPEQRPSGSQQHQHSSMFRVNIFGSDLTGPSSSRQQQQQQQQSSGAFSFVQSGISAFRRYIAPQKPQEQPPAPNAEQQEDPQRVSSPLHNSAFFPYRDIADANSLLDDDVTSGLAGALPEPKRRRE